MHQFIDFYDNFYVKWGGFLREVFLTILSPYDIEIFQESY